MKKDHCGIDTQTRLAVINCKGQKHEHVCAAVEMYMPSYVHRTQVAFIKQYYDAFVILSAKKGVLMPDDIIKPYSVILTTSTTSKALQKSPHNTTMLTHKQTQAWAEQVSQHPIFGQYDHVDWHLPNAYWKPLEQYVPKICKSWHRVKYPQSLITTGHRYEQLLRDLLEGRQVDLSIMGQRLISRYPEKKRFYYHNEYEPFWGWSRNLVAAHPQQRLDEGALNRVDKISVDGERYKFAATHHKGWCCDKNNLVNLYVDGKGRWRFKKQSQPFVLSNWFS